MTKPTRSNISELMFEYQLSLIGKTVQDALNNRNWKNEWSIPKEEIERFRLHWIPIIKKVFKCNKSKAQKTIDFFMCNFGLKEY